MTGNGPLSGYKVLDMTQFEAGTVCTETLAWMGAEVWKVERPVTGEQGRYSFTDPDKDGYGFILLNLNKESITCNAKKPEGLALMKRLAAEADVFVASTCQSLRSSIYAGMISPEINVFSVKWIGRPNLENLFNTS